MTTALSYNLRTAAEVTGLSKTHLNDALNRGELKGRRSSLSESGEPQGRWVILAADLEAYLAALPEG